MWRSEGRRRPPASLFLILFLGSHCGPLGPELLETPQPLTQADAIIVLGNRPPTDEHGRVMPETARRVRRGAELFAAELAPRIVFTGGSSGEGAVEAEVMADRAEELGVTRGAMRLERCAQDTVQNAGLSVRLLATEIGNRAPRIIVVSSPYHLGRARRLFECTGAQVQTAATEMPPDLGYQAAFTAYEYAVRMAYALSDPCSRARDLAQTTPNDVAQQPPLDTTADECP